MNQIKKKFIQQHKFCIWLAYQFNRELVCFFSVPIKAITSGNKSNIFCHKLVPSRIYLSRGCDMRYEKRMKSGIWENKILVDLAEIVDFYSKTTRLVMGALLGSLALILQSAGIFTGLGYIISMMATGPIVLAALLSNRIGWMTYFVTIFLLAMFQPSELFVFPFITGLIGLSIGFGLKYLKTLIFIDLLAAFCLSAGIFILLYGIGFPILGPYVSSQFNIMVFFGTITFSLIYSWIWIRISILAFSLFHKAIIRRPPFDKKR